MRPLRQALRKPRVGLATGLLTLLGWALGCGGAEEGTIRGVTVRHEWPSTAADAETDTAGPFPATPDGENLGNRVEPSPGSALVTCTPPTPELGYLTDAGPDTGRLVVHWTTPTTWEGGVLVWLRDNAGEVFDVGWSHASVGEYRSEVRVQELAAPVDDLGFFTVRVELHASCGTRLMVSSQVVALPYP